MASVGRNYAGRTSQDRREERRERLLVAGLAMIGRGGVAALSVRGVCAEAGLAPRYFYEEFGSTDELASQLFDREFDAGIARVGLAVAALGGPAPEAADAGPVSVPVGPSTLDLVEAAVGAVLDFVTELPERAALLLTESSGSGVLSERRQERMDDVAVVVAGFGRASYGGAEAPTSPAAAHAADVALQTAASFVAGGLSRTVDDWIRGRIDRPRDDLQHELAAQIVAVGDTAFARLATRLQQPE